MEHDVPELTDPGTKPLRDYFMIVYSLIVLYGPDATLTIDAGFNNISATVNYPPLEGLLSPDKM